jgi:menaquinone-dependent protoporphyrinogen IX oxidase
MKRVLVAYATFSGSTAEVAQVIREELGKGGASVEVLPIGEVSDLAGWDAVVLGAPMILGWHRQALRFLRRHRTALKEKLLAVFVTAISLTQTGDDEVDGVSIVVDEKLPKPPASPGRLTLRERYARLSNYCRPILRAARPARPVSIGVFGGRLEYGRLKWWAVVFAMVIVQAAAGDRRNWEAIRAWANSLLVAFNLETP